MRFRGEAADDAALAGLLWVVWRPGLPVAAAVGWRGVPVVLPWVV